MFLLFENQLPHYTASVTKEFLVGINSQGRKTNPNPNFWVRIFSVREGVFHVKGWGPKSSVCLSKPGKSSCFGGISRDFAGISRRHPKSLRNSAAEKRGLWEGVVQEPLRRALFCVFLCSEVIFSCKSHKFLSEIAPPMQAFSGKPPREKPQNAAAECFKQKNCVQFLDPKFV